MIPFWKQEGQGSKSTNSHWISFAPSHKNRLEHRGPKHKVKTKKQGPLQEQYVDWRRNVLVFRKWAILDWYSLTRCFKLLRKNTAYGRHWISWPMRIVSPLPLNFVRYIYLIFFERGEQFFFFGGGSKTKLIRGSNYFGVTKKSLWGEGGPMRGLELIMRPQGQWEA